MGKKIMAVWLALLAAAISLPVSASAEESGAVSAISDVDGAVALAETADGEQTLCISFPAAVIAAGDGGSVTLLDNVEVSSATGVAVNSSVMIDLNGFTIFGTHEVQRRVLYVYTDDVVVITDNSPGQAGGVVNARSDGGNALVTQTSDGAELIVKAGNFAGAVAAEKGEIIVLGGSFDTDVSRYLPQGLTQDTEGRVVLNENSAVASVDGVGYSDLREALLAANPGDTVELLKSVEYDSWEQVWDLSGVIFSGNGNTLKVDGITSLENHDAVIHSAGGNSFEDLTIDLSGLTRDSAAQGFRAFNAAAGDSFFNVAVLGCEHLSYGIFAGGAQQGGVDIEDCRFDSCSYAIGSEPGSAPDSLSIRGCTFTGCGYAAILYPEQAVFSGNTVTGGKLNIMHVGQTITDNSFNGESRVKFYAAPELFERNGFSADSYLDADESAPVIDVSRNYWGGGAPDAAQLGGVSVTGKDEYYLEPTMDDDDISVFCDVYYIYNNGAGMGHQRVLKGTSVDLPAPSKSGYAFLGWACTDGNVYDGGASVAIWANTTFEAAWVKHPDTPYVPEPEQPAEPETPVFPFSDVPASAWYYSAVKYVYDSGLMDGVDAYAFAPDSTLTRAMAWAILARMSGADTAGGSVWYAKAQEWAVASGVSDGEDPAAPITREQFVTMLWRLAGEPVYTADLSRAPDAGEISPWAQQAMCWAWAAGLVEGDETGAISPAAGASRAAAAALIMRSAGA